MQYIVWSLNNNNFFLTILSQTLSNGNFSAFYKFPGSCSHFSMTEVSSRYLFFRDIFLHTPLSVTVNFWIHFLGKEWLISLPRELIRGQQGEWTCISLPPRLNEHQFKNLSFGKVSHSSLSTASAFRSSANWSRGIIGRFMELSSSCNDSFTNCHKLGQAYISSLSPGVWWPFWKMSCYLSVFSWNAFEQCGLDSWLVLFKNIVI